MERIHQLRFLVRKHKLALPHLLQQVKRCPGMYLSAVDFDMATALLVGFDLANFGGVLIGFREWLIVKLGYGNNLSWRLLILCVVFPDAENPRQQLHQPRAQDRAVEALFSLLEEFWEEKEAPNGLRRIFLRYQEWLQRQDWYEPSSPDYIADSPCQ